MSRVCGVVWSTEPRDELKAVQYWMLNSVPSRPYCLRLSSQASWKKRVTVDEVMRVLTPLAVCSLLSG